MEYNYAYPDFLRFCSSTGHNIRSDGDVVWYNTIPVPNILTKQLFFSAEDFLRDYLNHLFSAVTVALVDVVNNSDYFSDLPLPSNDRYEDPKILLVKAQNIWSEKLFQDFIKNITKMSGLTAFKFDVISFEKALEHKGKKYKRLYYPNEIKRVLGENFSQTLNIMERNNGDFFGNVVADKLNIYRSGFSDAFAGIFNKLLDFKFDMFGNVDPNTARTGQTKKFKLESIGSIEPAEFLRGNLWEADLKQGGKINVKIDEFHSINDLDPASRFNYLLLALSREEMYIFDEKEKQNIEEFRYRVSQTLAEMINAA